MKGFTMVNVISHKNLNIDGCRRLVVEMVLLAGRDVQKSRNKYKKANKQAEINKLANDARQWLKVDALPLLEAANFGVNPIAWNEWIENDCIDISRIS